VPRPHLYLRSSAWIDIAARRKHRGADIGITVLPSYHVAEALAAGTLVTLLDDFQPPALPVNLVYTAGRFLPIKLRAFLDFATPRLKARLVR